jgi:hypothetical protein
MEKWERRDAKRAKARKMRVVGTSVITLQRIILAKAQAAADKDNSSTTA